MKYTEEHMRRDKAAKKLDNGDEKLGVPKGNKEHNAPQPYLLKNRWGEGFILLGFGGQRERQEYKNQRG